MSAGSASTSKSPASARANPGRGRRAPPSRGSRSHRSSWRTPARPDRCSRRSAVRIVPSPPRTSAGRDRRGSRPAPRRGARRAGQLFDLLRGNPSSTPASAHISASRRTASARALGVAPGEERRSTGRRGRLHGSALRAAASRSSTAPARPGLGDPDEALPVPGRARAAATTRSRARSGPARRGPSPTATSAPRRSSASRTTPPLPTFPARPRTAA